MTGYSATITEASRELTGKQKIMFKDTANCIKLDEATNNGQQVEIDVDMYVVISIHNEKSDNVDYDNIVIVDKNGLKYVTGSKSFISTFLGIWNDMQGEEEEWKLGVYKLDSKNYKGKKFLTCSVL